MQIIKLCFQKGKLLLLVLFFFVILIISITYWSNSFMDSSLVPETTNYQNHLDLRNAVIDGFWNGFFTVTLLIIPYISSRSISRQLQHYNSLVLLESQLIEMGGIINDNLFLIKGFKSGMSNGNIFWGKITTITVDKSHFQNLSDLSLINQAFVFFSKIRRINSDSENISKGYEELKNAYIQKIVTIEHYEMNVNSISAKLDELIKFNEDILEDLIKLLVHIRIQIKKDKPITTYFFEKFINVSGEKITLIEFDLERKRLEGEIVESSRNSSLEIEKIRKRTK